MIIKIDDEVTVNNRGSFRSGKITDISLSLLTNDPAGENGIQTQIYDTDMGYNGLIGYITENGDTIGHTSLRLKRTYNDR